MEGLDILQSVALFACVAGIILIALVFFAARAFSSNRNRQDPNMWNTRGQERPTYDEPDVESRGGFGGVPSTGQEPRPRTGDNPVQGGFGAPGGGAQSYGRDRDRDRDRDDDEVRSSGGFGGG